MGAFYVSSPICIEILVLVFSYADAKGWEVVPKGATCLFIQPVVEPNKNNQTIASTGLIVISNFPHAFSSKDRLWFALLAKKISHSLTI